MPSNSAAAAAKSLQSCPTLCDPIDGSPLGSPVPGILQARTLEWVAISFSNARKWKVKVKSLSCVQLLATPWTAAHQAPPSMGLSRQEYWSGVPSPPPLQTLGPIVRNALTWVCDWSRGFMKQHSSWLIPIQVFLFQKKLLPILTWWSTNGLRLAIFLKILI